MHRPALENNRRLYLKSPLPGSDSGAHTHSRDPSDKRCRCERVSLLSSQDWTPRLGAELIALREICSLDCSLPGSSVHGIFQAIVLEWVTIAFSQVRLIVFENEEVKP